MFKVIVAGSRNFQDDEFLTERLDHLLSNKVAAGVPIEIVSGTAKGADTLGEEYAALRGHQVKRMPADWDRYGRSAGYRRNEEMAIYADACVVFWDGESRGTKHMIDLCAKHKIPCKVLRYLEIGLEDE